MSFPGYYITKPVFPAIKSTEKLLAFRDSCTHSSEISIRFLNENIQSLQANPEQFIRKLCKKYNMSAGSYNFNDIRKQMAESYLVQTYNIVELFFKNFNQWIIYNADIPIRRAFW